MTEERRCPDDGELLRYLDEGSAKVAAHLDGCGRCRSRVDLLDSRSRAAGEWLRRHDAAVPSREAYDLGVPTGRWGVRAQAVRPKERGVRRTTRGWWAAAACIALLVVAVGPARGWVLDRFHALRGVTEAPTPQAPVEEGAGSSETGFVPRSSELLLLFEAATGRDEIRLVPAPDSLATVHLSGPEVELVFGTDRIRVRNGAVQGTRYQIAIPISVETVRVRWGERGESVVSWGRNASSRALDPTAPSERTRGGSPVPRAE